MLYISGFALPSRPPGFRVSQLVTLRFGDGCDVDDLRAPWRFVPQLSEPCSPEMVVTKKMLVRSLSTF